MFSNFSNLTKLHDPGAIHINHPVEKMAYTKDASQASHCE